MSLDTERKVWSAFTKGAAFGAGASGLGTIPIEEKDKEWRYAVLGGAVALGTFSAFSAVMADGTSETWVRECAE